MAEKTVIEQISELDSTLGDQIKTLLAAHPKIAVDDRRMTELFSIYLGAEEPATTTTTTTTETAAAAATVHTPSVPSAAATTSTAAPVTTAASTSSPSADSQAILAALNSLRDSVDKRLENVITKDQIPTLGASLVNDAVTLALRQSDELATIRETHRAEFPDKKWDKKAFEDFVLAAQDTTTKRNKYATLTDAYDAMVAKDRTAAEIAKGVAEGVKQKTSGDTVPGQTVSASMSAAQQVLAKARATNKSDSGSSVDAAVAELKRRERARDEAGATVN